MAFQTSALQEISCVILDLVKVIWFGVPILITAIIRTFIPRKFKSISGQTVLITGGANGLGRALTLEIAGRGANVVVVDVDHAAAELICEKLRRKQVSAYAYRVDVSSYEQVEAMAADVHKNVGPVDIVINNAALVYFDFLQKTTADIASRIIDINVKSHIWITGSGGGLGREIALQLASRGCNVIIIDLNLESAEKTCEDLRRKNVSAYAYQVDVSAFDALQILVTKISEEIGPVDILVNNAGLIHFDFLQNSTVENIHKLIDVNVKSYIRTTKIFLEKMIERKRGHIVAISSMSGMYAFPWATVYSTSKYAVNGFMAALTEQLRLQHYDNHIRTTCVCPYYIATRKDIIDFLKKPRFGLLNTKTTARLIVDGILRNEVNIAIPPFFDLGVRFMQLFPLKVQQLVRDYIIREYDLNSA